MKIHEELEKENKDMHLMLTRIYYQKTVTFDDLLKIKKLLEL